MSGSERLPWDHGLPFDPQDLDTSQICINGLWDMDRVTLAQEHLLPAIHAQYPKMDVQVSPARHKESTLFLVFDSEEDGQEAREVLINRDWSQQNGRQWANKIGFKLWE